MVPILTVNSVGYSQQKLKKVAMNILDGLNLSKINGHEIEQSLLLQLNNQHLLSCIFLYFIRLEICIFHCIIFCQAIQPMRSSGYESAGSKPIAGLDKQLCTSLLLKSTPFNPLNKVISKSMYIINNNSSVPENNVNMVFGHIFTTGCGVRKIGIFNYIQIEQNNVITSSFVITVIRILKAVNRIAIHHINFHLA